MRYSVSRVYCVPPGPCPALGAIRQHRRHIQSRQRRPRCTSLSGSLGGLVDDKKIADLPLNGRNNMDLSLLQPGITQHRSLGANPSSGGLWYSSKGAPVHSNNCLLDGAPLVNQRGVNSASLAGATRLYFLMEIFPSPMAWSVPLSYTAVSKKTGSRRRDSVFRTDASTVGSRRDRPCPGKVRFQGSVRDSKVYTANNGRPERKCR